jgi:hypothetical protein
MAGRILVVDDEKAILVALRGLCEGGLPGRDGGVGDEARGASRRGFNAW